MEKIKFLQICTMQNLKRIASQLPKYIFIKKVIIKL